MSPHQQEAESLVETSYIDLLAKQAMASVPQPKIEVRFKTGEGLANPHEWRTFIKSNVWKDLKTCLERSLEAIRADLESCNITVLPTLQAHAKALREVISIIEDMAKQQERT